MAETKNTFLKGKMNKDLDSRIVPNGEYREARNLSISRSEGSRVGEFENVLGNTSISSLTGAPVNASAETEIIGKFIDENSSTGYFFATDFNNANPAVRATAANNCFIVKVNLNVDVITAPVILVQGFFLNFNISFPITGVNLIEELLFFTDNLNQPRKINVTKALVADYYNSEANISVAKYAPYEPILVMERVGTTVNGAITNSATLVVASSAGVKVGDILTKKNKVNATQIPGLVTVIGIPTLPANTVTLSSPITLATSTAIDFTRPSMTNKQDFEMANSSSGPVVINPVPASSGDTNPITATYKIQNGSSGRGDIDDGFIYGGNNGIPRIGDLVSGDGISADTRVTSVEVINQNFGNIIYQNIIVTLNKTTTMFTADIISISNNPDYDAAWNGDEKILEDKFVRFSYRFKFDDNEYSLIAPFSQAMFIPKQYGEFGGGSFSDKEDMDNAYTSTIVNWFENNINNILLKIPMVKSTPSQVISNLHISKVDILYKESDALAVKVLETIDLQSLVDLGTSFTSISFQDALHSSATENPVGSGNYDINATNEHFLDYDYSSIKPYKTLPNNQITRVSDKVPIKALGQEVIGNRVVYGNYVDRHTSPTSIDYSAYATNKSTDFDNYTQFPKHQLKQDRTYQVGFVLADFYGRQSDVILSSRDGTNKLGSTVFNPYNDIGAQQQAPILNWLGNALNVTLHTAITGIGSPGSPGIYNEITKPLGWYSYRIVVKQKDQEYYNVYLPGFVNGLPIIENINSEKDINFFSTLQGDNINKVPRDLSEVGPTDKEFTTSENLIVRVNNPNIDNKPTATYRKKVAWNTQYYTGNLQQEILNISTIRDLEIQAIPFKAGAIAGEYGTSNVLQDYNYFDGLVASGIRSVEERPTPNGSIPYGTSGPEAAFHNGDSNPFVFKGDHSQNKKNFIGAKVFTSPVLLGASQQLSMQPFLSVAETRPVESLLDIFWETSLSGDLVNLNSLVDTQSDGVTGSNLEASSFPESITGGSNVGFAFNFLNGAGQAILASQVTLNSTLVITDSSATPNTLSPTLFTITRNASQTSFQITATNSDFFYNQDILDNPLKGIYNIKAKAAFDGEAEVDVFLSPLTLTNVAPSINSFQQPTSVTTAANQSIITLLGKNGSADTTGTPAVNTKELNWSIVSVSPIDMAGKFNIGSTSGELTTTGVIDDNKSYDISVKVTDCNGTGLDSSFSSVQFILGAAANNRVNRALCEGWQNPLALVTGCGESLGVNFTTSRFFPQLTTTSSTVGTRIYPANPESQTYNVLDNNRTSVAEFPATGTVDNETGALVQGTLFITPVLTNSGNVSGVEDDLVTFTIQRYVAPNWVQAVTKDTSASGSPSNAVTMGNVTLQVGPGGTDQSKHIFDTPGEYRVITTTITGGMCSINKQTTLIVNFGDDNHIGGSCFPAPL